MKVGLIGFGHIGRRVTDGIQAGQAGQANLTAILVRHDGADPERRLPFVADIDHLLASDCEVVVEVAGQAALKLYAERVLQSGRDMIAVSVGAFSDVRFYDRVLEAASTHGSRILIPSGAIAGLDMLAAAALGPIDSVTHVTRKHPRAFSPEQRAGLPASGVHLLFDGPARDGVRRFPENVNVAAAVSLAGVGFDATHLKVYADASVDANFQELEATGYFGRLHVQVENTPTDNVKTGRVVALSVVKALRNLTAPIVVGV